MRALNIEDLQKLTDADFLALLTRLGVERRLVSGKLRINAPVGVIDHTLKRELLARKAVLLASCTEYDEAPLSYAQERLWLLEQFQPGNFAYNIPESIDVRASIDAGILQQAVDCIVGRHETLRTDIQQNTHGTAFQRVHPQLKVPLQVLDHTHASGPAQQAELQQALRALAREPFDLRTAPLVRFYLIRMEAERHIVFINIHHTIADRWSLRILLRELLVAYNAYSTGQQPAFVPLTIQYREFARRDRLDSPASNAQMAYWKNKLAALPDAVPLPFLQHPAVTHPFDGAIHAIELSQDNTDVIRALARAHNASSYILLLAAFMALLHRFTGAEDLCVGSPVSSRHSSDTEHLIGFFVNTLVMRCPVNGSMSFVELLREVRETVLDAQAHQEVPLQKILSEMRDDPRIAGAPIFSTMMGFDSFVGDAEASREAATEAADSFNVPLDPGFAKFDLTLQMHESRNRIGGYFEYRTDLFPADAIRRFSEAFVLLLLDAVHDPEKQISQLQLISVAERERLLHGWNQTAMDFPRDRTIHELFEEQVERTPDGIAIVDGTEHITYRELNRKANSVAWELLAGRSALPAKEDNGDVIVGIHLERTIGMIAAMMGTLKAGAAYLPLDTQYPEARLHLMLEDSGAQCVISASWEELPSQLSARVLAPPLNRLPSFDRDRNPSLPVSPHALAYVIYTSGSTGLPKGVAIEHHSTVSFLTWGTNTFSKEELSGTLASTSICFDLSVFEIFLPLVSGGAVILAQDVLAFDGLPAAEEVTLLTTVPSAVSALLKQKTIPSTLRTINLAGEPLPSQLVDRLYAETGVTSVNDLYGPTETTTYSTWTKRRPGMPATIGRPLANTRIYLVDSALQLVPQGMPGELLIAGEGVARGYLGKPTLTAEKFVSLPHLGESGRAYRTGDLCSYHADGSLVYLGRIDQQVKVRGYRIEMGEVEAVISSHPTVDEAVVTVEDAGETGAALVAALRLRPGHILDIPGLIAHQAATLPGYMVARNIVAVDDFPRTANGKIDRKSVARLAAQVDTERPSEPPRDELETKLVTIWQEGFDLNRIGIDDDFFQLGGHSLLALRLFAEIESRLGRRMMLSVLFQAPTVRRLAAYMRGTP